MRKVRREKKAEKGKSWCNGSLKRTKKGKEKSENRREKSQMKEKGGKPMLKKGKKGRKNKNHNKTNTF